MESVKTGILVVSFGTSYEETRKKTIDKIEEDIRMNYPQFPLYRAWTSRMVMAKIEKRDGIHICDVKEAMAQMLEDGIREVIVQPTYVLTGIESDLMKEDVAACARNFDKVTICDSLIVSEQDKKKIVEVLADEYRPADEELLLFMGHGSEHEANSLYEELNMLFRESGYHNMHMGTVEGTFSLENYLETLKEIQPKRVLLAPFMIVAGDHACNDMAGDEEDSWKSILEQEGYDVSCYIKGLGEIPAVRDMLVKHTEAAVNKF